MRVARVFKMSGSTVDLERMLSALLAASAGVPGLWAYAERACTRTRLHAGVVK